MTNHQKFLKSYLFQSTPELTTKKVAERVAAIINDPTIKKTEVIRENGWVHGRIYPIKK